MSHLKTLIQTDTLEAQLREIEGLTTQFDMVRFMKRLTEAFELQTFMVVNMPPSTSTTLSAHTVITNWPTELLNVFDRQGLLATSPLFQRMRQSFVPFQMELEEISRARGNDVPLRLFTPYGLLNGAHFPVQDSSGMRGAVSFAWNGAPLELQRMLELSFVSIHVYERLGKIRELTTRPVDTVTERELDCLTWTAAGKTSAEIAEILGLSEHTVNHYLNRAAKKLNTVNRTQAVVTALRTGLIS